MNLIVLEAFRTVMETGTVSEAARVMGRSQSAVSRMLDKMEAFVGMPLFERRKGQIVPTEAAHEIVGEVEGAFLSLAALDTLAERMRGGEIGGVRVAALPALGLDFMPEATARFRVLHPRARVVLNVRMSTNVARWVATHRVDIGFAETQFTRPGFAMSVFSDSGYRVAMPPDHPLASREVVEAADLAGHPMVGWTPFAPARRLFDAAMQAAGVEPVVGVESTMSSVTGALVARGLGLGLVDPFTAASLTASGLICRPFLPTLRCRIVMLSAETLRRTPLIDDFIGCAEALRDEVLAKD